MKEIKVDITLTPNGESLGYPHYATVGSAGADLRYSGAMTTIKPGERKLFSTGIKLSIPEGYEGQIRPRSGLAYKHGITVLNAPGTIDSDYRGEVGVILINLSEVSFDIEHGTKIAQMVFAEYVKTSFSGVDQLSETNRGEGGFGHTGL